MTYHLFFSITLLLYKLDTLLLKQKKLPVLNITGFFFRMSIHAEKETYSCEKRNPLYPIQYCRGGFRGGGGAPGARPPLKLEKNMIFWRKIVIFHTKYPKNVRASLRNWKKYEFLA
jgi:hypothetical protein